MIAISQDNCPPEVSGNTTGSFTENGIERETLPHGRLLPVPRQGAHIHVLSQCTLELTVFLHLEYDKVREAKVFGPLLFFAQFCNSR